MSEATKKLSKREMRLMVVAITIILMYGIYAIIFAPTMAKRDDTNAELSRVEQQETQLNREIATYNQLKEQYQGYSFEELLIQLPNEGKVPEVILWLQELFQDPMLSRPNIGFSMAEEQEKYLRIGLTFTGPFENIHSLINTIEANERLTTIESISLSGGGLTPLSANLVTRIYGQNFTDISEEEYDFNKINLFRLEF